MTSVRSYGIEKERAIQEIQSGITEVKAKMAAGINEIQEGGRELERRMSAGINEIQAERAAFDRRASADIKQKHDDADRFAVDFWEGD